MLHLLVQYAAIEVDIAIMAAVSVVFRSGTLRFLWRSVSDFAVVKSVGETIMLLLLMTSAQMLPQTFKVSYFIAFYGMFIALTLLTLRIYYQIYIRATVPFQGFAKWGKSIFALVILTMAIMTLMTFGQINAGADVLTRAGINFLRAVNTVDFCFVAFLCYLIRAMGMPLRGKVFGVMFGFAIGNFASFLQMLFMQFNINPGFVVTFLIEYSSVVSALIWIGYAFLPEPLPRPVAVPAESPVYRWSQIANALGAKTSVAMPEPQHSFFLADVEQVVDKVFTRHMQESPESNG